MKKSPNQTEFLPEEFRPLLNTHRFSATGLEAGELERVFAADIDLLTANLRPGATNALDLGCGIGIVSALLCRKLARPDLQFFLFDRDLVSAEPSSHEFNRAGTAFNNSFAGAKRVIENLGLPERNFTFVEASAANLAELPPMDLIFSFAAWGYCFPVDLYLNEVVSRLRPGGTLIADLRVDAHAGFREGEIKISDRLGVLPDVLSTNFAGEYIGTDKPRLADSLPSGTRLKACRFRWIKPEK